MGQKIQQRIHNLSLAQSFMLSSLLILVVGMALIGAWVEQQIENGVVHRTAATTALYVDSFITPNLQELAAGDTLTPTHAQSLDRLLQQTTFGKRIAVFKVWSRGGRIIYSDDPSLIGQTFPVDGQLAESLAGQVTADISSLSKAENAHERVTQTRLLEMYSPVRRNGTDEVIGAAEFYYTVDELNAEIAAAQWRTWAVVGAATLVMYLLLAGFVRQASSTISRQRTTLSAQVQSQAALLVENEELNERVRRAAVRATALNERFLRRISAELHDGPAQDLGLALLRLDHVLARVVPGPAAVAGQIGLADPPGPGADDGSVPENERDLEAIGTSLRRAMQEIRSISGGLGVPHLETWTLTETLSRVISSHERQTGTKVVVERAYSREQVPLTVKIAVYRLVQEALRNAYRHADGYGQRVVVRTVGDVLQVEVADQGPGFDPAVARNAGERLGLIGMRERVESIGGVFRIESAPGQGTKIRAELPLATQEEVT